MLSFPKALVPRTWAFFLSFSSRALPRRRSFAESQIIAGDVADAVHYAFDADLSLIFTVEDQVVAVREHSEMLAYRTDGSSDVSDEHHTITGGRGDVQRRVGNAVPSLLAEVLGREIRRRFFDHSLPQTTPTLLPGRRDDLPPLERVKEVPSGKHP